jgi:hypothetical protein
MRTNKHPARPRCQLSRFLPARLIIQFSPLRHIAVFVFFSWLASNEFFDKGLMDGILIDLCLSSKTSLVFSFSERSIDTNKYLDPKRSFGQ